MKKWLSILAAAALMMSMATPCMAEATSSFGAPNQTTTVVSRVVSVETVTEEPVPDTFVVEVTENAAPVTKEIEKLYNFLNDDDKADPVAPIEYFEENVQQKVLKQLIDIGMPEDYDMTQIELNELITLREIGYEEVYGDVVAKLEFVTEYQAEQKLVGLIGFYSGEQNQDGSYVVKWEVAATEVLEDGMVAVTLSQQQMLHFRESATTVLWMVEAVSSFGVPSKTTTDVSRVETVVPSKTTTDVSWVVSVETVTGEPIADKFVVEITEDAEPVKREIAKLYSFVNDPEKTEPVAPIEYFEEDVRREVLKQLVEIGMPEDYDMTQIELNELVTLREIGYKKSYGNVVAKFKFVTEYQAGQKLVSLIGFYSGEQDEDGSYVVSWKIAPTEVLEDGMVAVKLSQRQMLRFRESAAIALAVLSEPMPETKAVN